MTGVQTCALPILTIWFFFRRNYKRYLLLFAYFAVCGLVLSELTHVDVWPYLAVGVVGCLARDFGWFRRNVQIWPTLNQIIDWEKVDRMAAHSDSREA